MSLFPKPLEKIVEPLLRPLFKSRGLAGTRILSDWPRIAGTELASHAVPEKLSFPAGGKTGGTLTIAVENGFALELQHLQPMILERINTYYGYQAVKRIAISHSFSPPPEPAAPPSPRQAAASGAYAVGNVADPELKSVLQSLANSLNGKYSG